MTEQNFFKVREITVEITPRSPASRVLFWFLYGVDPARITMKVDGKIRWGLPCKEDIWYASNTFHREGRIRG